MTHGDILKIGLYPCGWKEGTFVKWESEDTIMYEDRSGDVFFTHYKSVIAINGKWVVAAEVVK